MPVPMPVPMPVLLILMLTLMLLDAERTAPNTRAFGPMAAMTVAGCCMTVRVDVRGCGTETANS